MTEERLLRGFVRKQKPLAGEGNQSKMRSRSSDVDSATLARAGQTCAKLLECKNAALTERLTRREQITKRIHYLLY